MNRNHVSYLAHLLITAATSCCVIMVWSTGILAKAESKQPPSHIKSAPKETIRTIVFPDQSIGGLFVLPVSNWGTVYTEKEIAVAKGRVKLTIPPDHEVMLRANSNLLTDPSLLDKLPPDSIDALEIKGAFFDLDDDTHSDKIITHVAKLTGLSKLHIVALEPSDEGLGVLRNLKKLALLDCAVGKLDGTFLKNMRGVPISDLNISGNPVKAENYKYLSFYPEIKHLCLNRCRLEPVTIKSISKCSKLEDLNLGSNSKIKDECMIDIAKLQNLKILNISETGVTPRGLKELTGLSKLYLVVLSPSYFSAEVLADARKNLPHTSLRIQQNAKPVTKELNRIFAPISK